MAPGGGAKLPLVENHWCSLILMVIITKTNRQRNLTNQPNKQSRQGKLKFSELWDFFRSGKDKTTESSKTDPGSDTPRRCWYLQMLAVIAVGIITNSTKWFGILPMTQAVTLYLRILTHLLRWWDKVMPISFISVVLDLSGEWLGVWVQWTFFTGCLQKAHCLPC